MRFRKIHFGSVIRRGLVIAVLFTVFILWKTIQRLEFWTYDRGRYFHSTVPFPVQYCRGMSKGDGYSRSERQVTFNESTTVARRTLILTKRSSMMRSLIPVLEANRIEYDLHHLVGRQRDVLPSFTVRNVGKYAGIIFTSFSDYFALNSWNRQLLDKYCRSFSVGIVLFNQGEGKSTRPSQDFPFKVYTNIRHFKSFRVSKNATILRLVKADNVLEAGETNGSKKWSVFIPQSDQLSDHFEIVASSSFDKSAGQFHLRNYTDLSSYPDAYPVLVHDLGQNDRVQKVYFGAGLTFWPNKLLFLDALGFISRHVLATPLDRWIQIDIDDIFVGRKGIRMNKEDVKALINTQHKLQEVIPGFHFNLGFSGRYYMHGNDDENEGDQELLKNASEFWWFGHMWHHKQPHLIDDYKIMTQQVELNMAFAKEHNIPLHTSYSVAPHHSGVYPAHDLLYEVWGKVAGVKVTSTEEYPHLRPHWKRQGFIYHDIMVLPRQTCGLFTHTLFLDKYPHGKDVLLNSIYGGEVFQLFVNNQINIFMTHLSNYGSDRLALYTFTNVIKFVQCWTNLRLMSLPPVELGKKYFELFPKETAPVWQNPCKDARHKAIWPPGKSCNRLPSFIIVGPQKTGTTALYMFLSIHPEIVQNKNSEKSYEETQFFSSVAYYKGLDWYMDFFPDVKNSSTLVFEKTANYFDSNKAPLRVHALLPDAKIIVILNDPVRRAYSWYQHMRFHNNKVALGISFYNLLKYNEDDPGVSNLRKRCLKPGLYAENLERWLLYFPPSQILTIDGEQLRQDPAHVMAELQLFLRVKTVIDYETRLRYNERKGFFCLVGEKNEHNCLGKSKGRQYPPMTGQAEEFLKDFYREPNRQLVELLHKIRQPLPQWLSTEVVGLS